jgi:ribosomal protein S18 acetylase RimI-like enzyme
MTLRPDQTADEAAVIGLWRESGMMRWSDPRKDMARKMTVNPEWFLVGETDGRAGATCRIGYEGHRGWINLLAVAPTWQGGGPGRARMAKAERILRAEGCAKINRQVRATNPPVIAFDEKLGFGTEDFVNVGQRRVDD